MFGRAWSGLALAVSDGPQMQKDCSVLDVGSSFEKSTVWSLIGPEDFDDLVLARITSVITSPAERKDSLGVCSLHSLETCTLADKIKTLKQFRVTDLRECLLLSW